MLCQPIVLDHFKNGKAQSVFDPIGSQTTHDRYSMVTPLILGQHGGAACRPIDKPCPTIATKGAIRIATPIILDMSRPGGSDSGEETIVIQSEEVKPQSILQLTKLAARWSEYFTEPMDDAVNGEPARRYDGVLPQALAEELMGWLNGESETSEESENGRFPLSIWVNDDDYIVRVRTDLAVFLRDLVGEQMETMLEQYGLGGMDISMELKSVDTDIVLSQFNAVAPIAVPEDNG